MKKLILWMSIFFLSIPLQSMASTGIKYCLAFNDMGTPAVYSVADQWKTLLPWFNLGNHPTPKEVADAGAYVLYDIVPEYDHIIYKLAGPVATFTAGPSVTRTWTAERIPWAERVATKIEQIKVWCVAALATPVTSSALGTPHVYRSENDYKVDILGGILLGLPSVPLATVVDGNNITVGHSQAQIAALLADFATVRMTVAAKQELLFSRAEGCGIDNDSCLAAVVWSNDSP